MNPLYRLYALAFALLVALCIALPAPSPARSSEERPLLLYCAAALREPIDEILTPTDGSPSPRVQTQYGGSNTLLSQATASQRGDLLLAADASYIRQALERGIATRAWPIGTMSPVVVTRKDHPVEIKDTADLTRLRLSLGAPEQTAIGRATREAFTSVQLWRAIDAAARERGVYQGTVGGVVNDVLVGAVDAGVVWDAVAAQQPELGTVTLPALAEHTGEVAICVLASSPDQERAAELARTLSEDSAARVVWSLWGLAPPNPREARDE